MHTATPGIPLDRDFLHFFQRMCKHGVGVGLLRSITSSSASQQSQCSRGRSLMPFLLFYRVVRGFVGFLHRWKSGSLLWWVLRKGHQLKDLVCVTLWRCRAVGVEGPSGTFRSLSPPFLVSKPPRTAQQHPFVLCIIPIMFDD